jgi:hypothetical protein
MGWLPDPNAAAAHGLWKDPEIDEAVKSQKPDGSAKSSIYGAQISAA